MRSTAPACNGVRPSGRSVVANWEHRFFGSSYLFTFDHRTPLSVVSLHASRNITSYPQQLATLPPTGSVAALLFSLFATRIPGSARSAGELVDQFITRARACRRPSRAALSLYTQQITLQEHATATFGLLGARNSVSS